MARCEVCGNEYDKAFTVTPAGESEPHTFDSFECAIHAVAPRCEHCGCNIVGHGVEADGRIFCCAHCANQMGFGELRDRADSRAVRGSAGEGDLPVTRPPSDS